MTNIKSNDCGLEKITINLLFLIILSISLGGCLFGPGMDLDVDVQEPVPEHGKLKYRVDPNNCRYYMEENAPDPKTYKVLAKYVITYTPVVITSRSIKTMICYAYKRAVWNGADTIIVDEVVKNGKVPLTEEDREEIRIIMKKNPPPGAYRTTPIVRVRAIRFIGELPPEFKEKK